MMKKILLFSALFLLTADLAAARNISVEVVSDNRHIFPTYPVDAHHDTYRSYLQAERNARYSIRIRNYTDKRIGLVVAVDGRNIISGKQSSLRNTERMYILEPYASGTYRGWRTHRNEIRRFYFTDEGGSYAGAWGDYSAMGVIAVAAYAEQEQAVAMAPALTSRYSRNSAPGSSGRAAARMESRAGTGAGEREDSSSGRVHFTADPYPLEKHLYKYEWRETLCRKNIIPCNRPHPNPRPNRLWDNGYVQPPPGRRNW